MFDEAAVIWSLAMEHPKHLAHSHASAISCCWLLAGSWSGAVDQNTSIFSHTASVFYLGFLLCRVWVSREDNERMSHVFPETKEPLTKAILNLSGDKGII